MTESAAARRGICVVSTVPVALTAFMAPHILALCARQPIVLVTSGGPDRLRGLLGKRVTFVPLEIARDASVLGDLRALLALFRLFRAQRFEAVISITPKAGLLAMLAARMAGVPLRIHWFVGQVWATRRGMARRFLRALDTVLARAATHLLADSPSQRAFLEAEGVTGPGVITVFGDGSVCGVDTTRFRPDSEARHRIRTQLGIPPDAMVALFVGRLNRDKGTPEMTEAFAQVAAELPELHLLLVGTDEGNFRPRIRERLGDRHDRVHFVDYTYEVEAFMAASDVFLLPSHREGFGATVIEAAACEVPSIATRIYGLTDAIADGESGVLLPVQDVPALAAALRRLVTDHEERHRLGRQARLRVEHQFSEARLTAAFQSFYTAMVRR